MMRNILFIPLFISGILTADSALAQDSNALTSNETGKNINSAVRPEQNFRMALGGGYGYRLGKIEKTGDQTLDNFSRGLRSGYNLDLEMQYFIKKMWGLGINANYVQQNKQATGQLNIPNVGTVSNYKESNKFLYVGPSFIGRFEKNRFTFYIAAGVGPIFYTNKGEFSTAKAQFSKTVLGSYVGFSTEYRVSENIGTGLKLSVTGGSAKIAGYGGPDDRLNLSNLQLTGFISFRTK